MSNFYGTVILWHYIKGSGSTTKPIDKLSTGLRSTNTLNINFFSLTYEVFTTSRQSDNWSTPSQYSLLICCRHFSPTNHLLIENHRSLIQIYASPRLWNRLPDSSRQPRQSCLFTSSFTCQLITVIVTTLIIHHSFTFISGSKPTFLTYPSHLDTSSTLLPSRSQDWLDLSCLSIYSKFVFFLFFSVCSVWWTKLATRQLFTAR